MLTLEIDNWLLSILRNFVFVFVESGLGMKQPMVLQSVFWLAM